MNFGFNSNVRVGGAVYHVQSEDRGPTHPYLDTVVYRSGRVVHKRSTSYADFAGSAEPESMAQQLHEKLAHQHRDVIAELEGGSLSLNSNSAASPQLNEMDSVEGLVLRLLNPKSWLTPAGAILEVELQRRNSTEPIADADVEAFLERDKQRTSRVRTRADEQGRATLRFPMPSAVEDDTSLVIRATDGDLYGELRFRLKARRHDQVPSGPSK